MQKSVESVKLGEVNNTSGKTLFKSTQSATFVRKKKTQHHFRLLKEQKGYAVTHKTYLEKPASFHRKSFSRAKLSWHNHNSKLEIMEFFN